jgi:hypothetical protein
MKEVLISKKESSIQNHVMVIQLTSSHYLFKRYQVQLHTHILQMASSRPLVLLSRVSRTGNQLSAPQRSLIASFSTSSKSAALPKGTPPSNFRLPPEINWENDPEPMSDRIGKYFLMNELFRGAYVVLEQFFRPPLVSRYQISTSVMPNSILLATQFIILLKRVQSLLGFEVNML